MGDVIEGRNAVLEALRAGGTVRELLIARGLQDNRVLREIGELAARDDVPVREVDRHELDELSARGAHQGVVGVVGEFSYARLGEVVRAIGERSPSLVIVLDHVTDPGNLGAVIRSAEALGADAVVIPKARAASVGPVVVKAAAGATAHLPIALVPNIARALAELKQAGFWVAGASERAEEPAWDAALHGRLVLVLGAEGAGLSRLVEEACDFLVRIPLAGKTGSLNVAQAATVLAYEWARRSAE